MLHKTRPELHTRSRLNANRQIKSLVEDKVKTQISSLRWIKMWKGRERVYMNQDIVLIDKSRILDKLYHDSLFQDGTSTVFLRKSMFQDLLSQTYQGLNISRNKASRRYSKHQVNLNHSNEDIIYYWLMNSGM